MDSTIKEYSSAELESRKRKFDELSNKFITEPDADQKKYPSAPVKDEIAYDKKEEDNKDKEEDNQTPQLNKADPKKKTLVRNLRIREDTAKYLRNLDPNSAEYIPKSRSMKENPNPLVNEEDSTYLGDDILKKSGDVEKFKNLEDFAIKEKDSIIFQGAPSQVELYFQKYNDNTQKETSENRQKILAKYGDISEKDDSFKKIKK